MHKTVSKIVVLTLLLTFVLPAFAQDVITVGNANELEELMRLGRGKVLNAQFSPDGEQIIVGSSIGVWVYDTLALDTELEPTLYETAISADVVAVSPDGSAIAVMQDDMVQAWAGGEMVVEVDTNSFLQAIAISPDSTVIATAHSDDTIKLWDDITTDEPALILEGHSSDPNTIAYSPDGTILASGSDDDTVRLWDTTSGEELAMIETGVDINVLSFTPDGSAIVTGDDNGALSVWDAASGELLLTFEEGTHSQAIISIAVSPAGDVVATGSWDDDIRIWDIADGSQRAIGEGDDAEAWIQPEMGDINSLQFSADGSTLLVAADEEFVALYDLETREILLQAQGYTDSIEAFAFSPDGTLLSFSDNDGDVWVWTVGSTDQITQIPHVIDVGTFSGENSSGLVYSPDGTYFVVEGSFEVTTMDASTAEVLNVLEGEGLPDSIAISPDSTIVAYIGSRGAYVFNAESALKVGQMTKHTEWGRYIAFSPDGTLLVTSADDGTVRIWAVGA